MGNIRQTYIKRVAVELVQNHPEAFSADFAANRVKVLELTDLAMDTGDGKKKILYKKLVNRVAGYVTRYHRTQQRKIADTAIIQS